MRRRLASLIAIVACAACSSPEQRLAEHLEVGAHLAAEGERDAAILEYRSALQLAPTNAEVNERLADELAAASDLEAGAYYRDAFRLDPERVRAAVQAVRLMMLTDVAGAAELLAEVEAAHPDEVLVYVAKSDLALFQNNSRTALAAATRARDLDPTSALGWQQLGKAYHARIIEKQQRKIFGADRDFEAAIAAFSKADEIAGGSIRSRRELARVYATRSGPTEADRAQLEFERAMTLARETGEWRDRLDIALAAVEFAQRQPNTRYLTWALREVVDAAPDHLGAWNRRAALEDSEGGDGLRVMEEMIGKLPQNVFAHVVYVNYLVSKSRTVRAMQHLRGLLDSGFDAPEFWEQIVRIQIRRGKTANARATYVSMAERHPDDPVTRRTDARIAMAEERYAAASETLAALAGEHDSPQIQFLLAQVEFELGNLANAAAAIEKAALDLNGTTPEVDRLKARIHHAAGEWDLVIETYRKLAEQGVRLRGAERLLLVQSLYEAHKPAQAREALVRLLEGRSAPPAAAAEFARREGSRSPEEALAYLTKAHERAPLDFEVLEALTNIDVAAGRRREAMARLNRALESGSAGPSIALLRARLRANAGRGVTAERDALLALQGDPSSDEAIELLLSIYVRRGNLERTAASFEEARAAGVLHPGARRLLGRIYQLQGESERAAATLDEVVAGEPTLLGAKADLAVILAESDRDLDRAMELAEEVQQRRSRNPDAAEAVGYVYLRKGLNEAALQQFRYAIDLDEQRGAQATPRRHYLLGLALRALNRNADATRAFERALQLDPAFRSADDARSQLEATRALEAATPSPS